ncbi:PDZ domain-containing protein [Acidicapsa acidisoli]|uniref:PDZ domain-containing protein n=1 Tax=Acidicapsa acidisoli TaxID=1615681 RepID=UPI0021E05B6E|nr:PDZ domain-containing protein [Acidicapsa acidisoli]
MDHFLRPCRVGGVGIPGRVRFFAGVLVAGGLSIGLAARAQSLQLIDVLDEPTLLLLHSKSQGFLGVDVGDVDADRAQALHLKDTRGAEITILDHDAPAGKAGLMLHDVILQVNGREIDDAEQVKQILHEAPPGRKLQLLISRDGALQTVPVQLADRRKVQEEARERLDTVGMTSGSGNSFVSNGADLPSAGGFHSPFFGSSLHVGAMVEPLTAQMADFLGVGGGVMIKSVARRSEADVAGLRSHDVILEVGGETVVTSSDWERLLRSSEGKPVQVEILRDRMKQLVLLQVDGKRHKS